MKLSEAVRIVSRLQAAYPRQEYPDSTAEIYAGALLDLEAEDVEHAAVYLVRTSKWFPTISEIRERVAEDRADLPEPEMAWAEVREAIGRYGLDQTRPAWSCAEIGDAVRVLGWRTLCTSTNIGLERERWIKTYTALRRKRIEQIVAPAGALPGQLRLLPGGGKA